MKIKGIDVVYLHTPHPELAQWYADTLGLSKGYGDETWQELNVSQGSRLGFDVTSFPRSVVEKQPIVLSFAVDDIHQAVEELTNRGVRFYPSSQNTIFDVGPALVATFEDPDGNWVQLSQPKSAP